MMKKYAFILWAALTMTGAFTACTGNDSPMTEQTEAKTVTIRATIDGDIGSRVVLEDDATNQVVKVNWKQGDDFNINVNGTDYTFTYTENDKFECYNFPTTFPTTENITATYPATAPTAYANQSGTLEGAASLLTMTATLEVEAGQSTENLALTFKHNNSIVKLTLSNEDFKEKDVTWVTLQSGNTVVTTATDTFTGDADNGSIVAYFAVMPQAMTGISIRAVCEYKNYTAELTDNTLAEGKLYNVTKSMVETASMGDKTAAQAIKGDFAMADGSFISKDATLTDEQKANVAGIVFWTTADMNTDANAETPAKLTDDAIMATDFPHCTHGLIVSLKDVSTGTKWQSTSTNISDWQSNTFVDEKKDDYKSIASFIGATDLVNYILGYQNTKLFKAYNEQCEEDNKVLPVSLLADFETNNPAPAKSTGWFIPSLKELTLLCGADSDNVGGDGYGSTTKGLINGILNGLGTDKATSIADSYYWSSSECADLEGYAFVLNFLNVNVNRGKKEDYTYCVRAVCAY